MLGPFALLAALATGTALADIDASTLYATYFTGMQDTTCPAAKRYGNTHLKITPQSKPISLILDVSVTRKFYAISYVAKYNYKTETETGTCYFTSDVPCTPGTTGVYFQSQHCEGPKTEITNFLLNQNYWHIYVDGLASFDKSHHQTNLLSLE
eukprot:Blabericola_migrator_1__3156@NODE_1921_length_3558_cov_271_861644_g1228_i0_p3_GENE_NODE_1921_length_3558_cov_271_861644_g1228_i0NODE_1921_length_3558_cov_271_861644_g1228_i0_p3_ORF_typecomplete_len153_score15_62_NODE_1921_length_3558_cov_271_861644_g1228_i026393097